MTEIAIDTSITGTVLPDRIERDGKVAVLYSPGYGSGFVTENKVSPFCPQIVLLVLAGRKAEITEELVAEVSGDEWVHMYGARELEVEWVPKGTRFRIHEYDGSEYVEYLDDTNTYVA